MGSAREIRSRVTSIRNTQKVTRAMQMVSAAKMQRAVKNVLDIRPYAHNAWSILANMSRAMKNRKHPLLDAREISNVLIVVIASNRGLCGGFNTQVQKKFRSLLSQEDRLFAFSGEVKKELSKKDRIVDVVAIGRKAEKMATTLGKNLIASFPDLMHTPSFDEARTVANTLIDWYLERRYDKIVVVYTDYISALKQETKTRQILPVSVSEFEKQLAEMDILQKEIGLTGPSYEYKIEPSPEVVLDALLPALIRTQIYHMVLESNASKEASRMVAMKNATDAAGEIADEFMLVYNRIRQAKITQEIAEISAGRAALE
ncbi:MAG: ATP synthase F1 subunit gamma [Candidatus Moraniibacteriota bacterium]|nr:MAG: ATP synthase F1 subunit gamma [Candidatus Moranbacteria bacterium]